ncbi:MAG: CAP domain-containing protein [Candidatus Humimicrobiaceae bacterium]
MTRVMRLFISFLLLTLIAILLLFSISCKTGVEKLTKEYPYLQLSEEEVKEGISRSNIEDLCLTADEIRNKCCCEYAGNIEVAGIAEELELSPDETLILHFINFNRTQNGVNTILPNEHLSSIARIRSADMLNRNYFSHYTPEGKNVFDILKENNVIFKYAGENLAKASPTSWGSPEAITIAWMNSPTHKDNILRSAYGGIGICVIDGGDTRMVTTIFMN